MVANIVTVLNNCLNNGTMYKRYVPLFKDRLTLKKT